MYALLTPAWNDQMTMKQLAGWLNPAPLPILPLPPGLVLPDKFIAVRIYARATMEPNDGVVFFLKAQLERLAKKWPLVFLTSDLRYDDHADIVRPFAPNMVDLSRWLTPQNNLAVQLAVLQRSMLLLATYGGLAQLNLRAGKPSIALYSKWGGTAFAHVDLTHRLALATGTPFHLANVSMLEQMLEILA
jgi:hypothetical protein